jgi:hypothetical protein
LKKCILSSKEHEGSSQRLEPKEFGERISPVEKIHGAYLL